MSDIATTIGNRLKDIRTKANITQTDLREKAGVSQTYLSRVEHGKTVPTIPTLLKLTDALGYSLSTFLLVIPESNAKTNQEGQPVVRPILTDADVIPDLADVEDVPESEEAHEDVW